MTGTDRTAAAKAAVERALDAVVLPRPAAAFLARSAGAVSRRLGRGGGTTLPGVVLMRLRPDAIREFSADLANGSVLVSATNGKTTTTRLLAAAIEANGLSLVTNSAGSNLERGVAAALLTATSDADTGLFEVDEAALGAVAHATRPSVIVLMNLFRDQLDRYGELETLVAKWEDLLEELDASPAPPTLVLNADDPTIASLGFGRDGGPRSNVVWFGVDDTAHDVGELAHAADATTCRSCGEPIVHDVVLVGHLGHWHCSACDRRRPTPAIAARTVTLAATGQQITLTTPDGDVTVESALPGLHNAYNIAAAFAGSWALAQHTGRDHRQGVVGSALGKTKAAFGRGEAVMIDDRSLQLMLAKNPTGVNQNIRTALSSDGELHVLAMLNDRTADGQDVSWIWDVDWEPLVPRLASLTVAGDRAWDLALRFRYGGFDMDKVTVAADTGSALDTAMASAGPGDTVFALPTYTAMLDLRSVLTERGHTQAYWSES